MVRGVASVLLSQVVAGQRNIHVAQKGGAAKEDMQATHSSELDAGGRHSRE